MITLVKRGFFDEITTRAEDECGKSFRYKSFDFEVIYKKKFLFQYAKFKRFQV